MKIPKIKFDVTKHVVKKIKENEELIQCEKQTHESLIEKEFEYKKIMEHVNKLDNQ